MKEDTFSAAVCFDKNRIRIDWKLVIGAHEQTKTGQFVIKSLSDPNIYTEIILHTCDGGCAAPPAAIHTENMPTQSLNT